MTATEIAEEWINTDKRAVMNDVRRLGLSGAAEYNMELIEQAIERGDDRWVGVTTRAMRRALASL